MSLPLVCLNGEFVPVSAARVPVTDRAFLYGDGLFETLRVYQGLPFLWPWHLERLRQGARVLGLPDPAGQLLLGWVEELLERNRLTEAVVRLQISRGSGPRGYSPVGAGPVLCLVTAQPAPALTPHPAPGITLRTSTWRLSADDRLAACKSANRLIHVLATAEAQAAGADEALLFNHRNEVAEAASANFFWIAADAILTPPAGSGALLGVTRRLVFELAARLGVETRQQTLAARQLDHVTAAFLTSSVQEVRSVRQIDGRSLVRHALVDGLHRAYRDRVEAECRPRRRARGRRE
jgi:branched-chain amino acid aminotransferase